MPAFTPERRVTVNRALIPPSGDRRRQSIGERLDPVAEETFWRANYTRETDLHLAAEDEHPLRFGRAMPLAAKADRAVPQLVAGGGEHLREHRLRIAFGQRDRFLFEFRSSIAVGEQHYPGEIQADPLAGGLVFLKPKTPRSRSSLPPLSVGRPQ